MTGSLAARWLLTTAFARPRWGSTAAPRPGGQGRRGPGGSFLPGEATRAKDTVLNDHPAGSRGRDGPTSRTREHMADQGGDDEG